MAKAVFQNGEFTNPRTRFPARRHAGLMRSWWLAAFSIGCAALYFQAGKKRDAAISEISYRLQEMEKEKLIACQSKEDLQTRLCSQNDPAWIELVLMRDLGVVPEGWIKVHFIPAESSCDGAAVYRNTLKNRELGKKEAQIWASGSSDIAKGQGANEDLKDATNPVLPKTASSGCFCINTSILET